MYERRSRKPTKTEKKVRSIRYIRSLISKLDDALETRMSMFIYSKEFYCQEAENLREAIDHLNTLYDRTEDILEKV